MLGRDGGEKLFPEERVGIEFVAANGKGEDGDIDISCAQAVEENGSDFFDDGEAGLRDFLREGSEFSGKKIRGDGRNYAYRDGADDEIFLFGDIAFGGFKFTKDTDGAGEKGFAEVGEAHGASKAVEEARKGRRTGSSLISWAAS